MPPPPGEPPSANGAEDSWALLSGREREVVVHIAEGLTYAAVAHRMGLSRHTIDTYLRRVRRKTGVTSLAELAILAFVQRAANE
ncbi:response regulator transcription factor [Nocardia sp. NPDC050412]|uniref:response regulator transcription factor n=1 Tax=Nocardia sp. NPDC050412 TaxID=3364320 RepID=UPI0037A6CDF5